MNYLDPEKINIEQLYLDNPPEQVEKLEELVGLELEMQNEKKYIDLDRMKRKINNRSVRAKNTLPEYGRDVKAISQLRMEEFYIE
jgi:hypothetical protein